MKREDIPDVVVERFHQRYTVGDGCWEWKYGPPRGIRHPQQRPAMRLNGRTVIAARISLTIATGELSETLMACHHCDNPICVRPDHLYAGTARQNAADVVIRGRRKRSTDPASIPVSVSLRPRDMRRIAVLRKKWGLYTKTSVLRRVVEMFALAEEVAV